VYPGDSPYETVTGSELKNLSGQSSECAREQIRHVCTEEKTVMRERLAYCAEHLRKAVRFLANSSCGPREKLTGIYNNTELGSIRQDDFPDGTLKTDYLRIMNSLIKVDEPKLDVNIAAMSDEQARKI
jgi:hypothetical protein